MNDLWLSIMVFAAPLLSESCTVIDRSGTLLSKIVCVHVCLHFQPRSSATELHIFTVPSALCADHVHKALGPV